MTNHFIKTNFSEHKIIIDFFEDQVKQVPDNIAVISQGKTLTYRTLNQKANFIAQQLIKLGIQPNDIIPIFMPRCEEMIVAVFAVIKAGAAYLPLDVLLPIDRLRLILENSKAKCVLSMKEMSAIQNINQIVILLDDPQYIGQNFDHPSRNVLPSDLAYVCYTSGSSGQPKGVQIEHRSLVNRLEWMQTQFPICSQDCLFQKTFFSFDVSVWEIFWWSMVGASVVLLPPKKEHDPKTMVKLIMTHRISVIHFVPSVLSIFLEYLSYHPEIELDSLKWVFSSGEVLSSILVSRFYSIFNHRQDIHLVNLYGPTEATIDVSSFVCLPNIIYQEIPIGRPIQNTRFYVLTLDNRLGGEDEIGELLIAGVGVAQGYLNDSILTKEKFIALPEVNEERVYRTGDLVKRGGNGEFLYLGRIDEQVKIRGLRIELGEIEYYLCQHPSVNDSAVIVIKDNTEEAYLVACIRLMDGKKATEDDLKEFLSLHLPSYMIPLRYQFLEKFPIKSNGKMNKKELEKLVAIV